MRKQDYLLHLIKSLTPSERRYFRLFSGILAGEKEYMRLFDALEGKEEYDTDVLSKELGMPHEVLAEKKHYLGQVIIKSLQNSEAQLSDINAVFRAKEEAALLLGRRLYDYTLDVINKNLAKAWELELFEAIPEMLLTKLTCFHAMSRFSEMPAITAESEKASAALSELFVLYELRGTATYYEQSRNKHAQFTVMMKHPLLKGKVEKLKSLKAQMVWFNIKNFYYTASEEPVTGRLAIAQQEVEHYQKHPQIKALNAVAYFISFIRLAEAESAMGNYAGALQGYEKLRNVIKPSQHVGKTRAASLLEHINLAMASELRHLCRFKEALAMIEKNEAVISLRPLNELYGHTFDYAVTLFNLKRSKAAIDKTEELLKIKDDVANDRQLYVRALMILAQMDIGSYELIPYLIKSSKAWMKRHKVTSAEIELFFSLTYAIATAPESERRPRWIKLKDAVEKGKLDTINKELNLTGWLGEKLVRK